MILYLQLFSSLILLGLIWTIQLVHYPAFYYIEDKEFIKFEQFHSKNITFIVAPLMLIELTSAVLLISKEYAFYWILNLILILIIWAVTIFISIPCHNLLMKGKSTCVISRLVKTNWIRTVLWTVKTSLVAFYALA